MTLEKSQGEETLRAIENAIRYVHLDSGSQFEIDALASLHYQIVCKLYRSNEMRNEKRLALSVREGKDLGTHFTREKVQKST